MATMKTITCACDFDRMLEGIDLNNCPMQWECPCCGALVDEDAKHNCAKLIAQNGAITMTKAEKLSDNPPASVDYRYNTGKPLGSADIRYIKQVGKLTKLDWNMIAARPTTLQRYVLEAKDSGKTVEELVESWDTAKANKPIMSIEKFNKKFNKTAKMQCSMA